MSVPPRFAAHRLTFGDPASIASSVAPTRHTLEVYLDYVCPFSAKIFKMLYGTVIPEVIKPNPALGPNIEIIFRQQVQPWHPQSTMTHEAACVVNQLAPAKFWDFSAALFAESRDFYDVFTANESRNAIYARLAKVAAKVDGVDEAKVLEMLTVPDKPDEAGQTNFGNAAMADMKLLVKMARLTGVHVSPTVIFDGVVRNEISSGWTKEQWEEWLGKNVD